ncbi:short-chain dehydrogenase [Companilactobacillus farciminis]|nr:short-chain dehydrogenase [Companilactobacillus farciminis]
MPYLKKTKGSIISTASAGGIIGFPDAVSYGATKGGIISLRAQLP